MASVVTNRGKLHILTMAFRNTNPPDGSAFKVTLLNNSVSPNEDTNTQNDVSGGVIGTAADVTRDASGFNVATEDDSNDKALIQVKDVDFAGALTNARYAILTDANSTANDRVVYAVWDFGENKSVSAGQTLTLQDLEINLNDA